MRHHKNYFIVKRSTIYLKNIMFIM